MKKISVIIPVYNVENYLERCLKSLVSQTIKDIEIIIVNDGSTDGSQRIIDTYKDKYPNMIKAYYIKNQGAAKARNYGLDYVTGEYIGFLDSDDYVSEEMYEKLYNEAKQKEADIVCCNYYRVVDEKKFNKKTFGNEKILKEDLFDKNIYEANLLFDEVPYLWNKIFKAELIKNNDIKFCNELRIYEDLLFTYTAFSKANKISRVDEELYFYMVSRQESLTHIFTEKRFDIFKLTDKLIEHYKSINKYEEIKEALIYVILKHVYVVLEKKTLKKEIKLKLRYINEIFAFFDTKFPKWKENMYFDLQAKNQKLYTSKLYWKLCVILRLNIVNTKEYRDKMAHKLYKLVLAERPGKVYIKQAQKLIDEKSIFIFSQQGNNLNGNMFYILKELAENEKYNGFTINVGYTGKNNIKFKRLLEHYNISDRVKLVKNKTNKFARILAKSKYIFSDTSMPTYFIKRKEQIYLNTWHGTPLKTLGKSTENDFYDIANVQKNFVVSDYLLYPSEYMMDIMIRDYMLQGIANNKIMLCGYPRNEIFLRDDIKEAREKNKLNNKTIIAYMPTWRGLVREVEEEKQLDIVKNYIKEISERLTEDQILYLNMHPFIGNKIDLSNYKNVKNFPKDIETYDFLSLCDILITDYSSVFFDFAITNKKIILFTYDEKEYFKDRGVYLPFEELPFPKVKDVEDLIKEVNSPIQYDSKKFLERFCKYERKDISKLICEKIVLNEENAIETINMPEAKKENVLIYVGCFKPNDTTKDFINVLNNTKQMKYNYYISYITEQIRPNKEIFKKVINKARFYGQLGENSNISRLDVVLIKLLESNKKLYSKFKKRFSKLHKLELTRIYQNINFKAAILYGEIESKKLYQLSELNCKKILYIKEKHHLNKKVNKDIYNNMDYILTTNQETYDMIKEYCGQNNNLRLINDISNLQDFNDFIE